MEGPDTHTIREAAAEEIRHHPGDPAKYPVSVKINYVPTGNTLFVVVAERARAEEPPECPGVQPANTRAPDGRFRCFQSTSARTEYRVADDFAAGERVFAWLEHPSPSDPATLKTIVG